MTNTLNTLDTLGALSASNTYIAEGIRELESTIQNSNNSANINLARKALNNVYHAHNNIIEVMAILKKFKKEVKNNG